MQASYITIRRHTLFYRQDKRRSRDHPMSERANYQLWMLFLPFLVLAFEWFVYSEYVSISCNLNDKGDATGDSIFHSTHSYRSTRNLCVTSIVSHDHLLKSTWALHQYRHRDLSPLQPNTIAKQEPCAFRMLLYVRVRRMSIHQSEHLDTYSVSNSGLSLLFWTSYTSTVPSKRPTYVTDVLFHEKDDDLTASSDGNFTEKATVVTAACVWKNRSGNWMRQNIQ